MASDGHAVKRQIPVRFRTNADQFPQNGRRPNLTANLAN
jgi:hypothetical protein